jgi:hypothetical protein
VFLALTILSISLNFSISVAGNLYNVEKVSFDYNPDFEKYIENNKSTIISIVEYLTISIT